MFVLAAVVLLVGGGVTAVLLLRGDEQPATLTDLSARLGCTGLVQETGQTELFVREQGRCEFAGSTVTLYTFGSDDTRVSWVNAASQFGGVMVVGERWTASVGTPAVAEQVRAKLGGEVR